MTAEEAQDEYMKILKLWSGYGTTLYKVTVSFTSYCGLSIVEYLLIV